MTAYDPRLTDRFAERATPAVLLDSSPVHSISAAAVILQRIRRNGEPDRRAIHALIREGKLAIVDDTQAIHRWTVSATELRRYIAEGPRRPALKAVAS